MAVGPKANSQGISPYKVGTTIHNESEFQDVYNYAGRNRAAIRGFIKYLLDYKKGQRKRKKINPELLNGYKKITLNAEPLNGYGRYNSW